MGDGSRGMIAARPDRPRFAWGMARVCTLALVVAAGFLSLAATAQAVPDTLVLTPDSGDNPIGTTHKLTATVTELGAPVADVQVGFVEQSGSVNATFCQESTVGFRFVTTDANGQATCTYTGSIGGTDTIRAFADTNSNFASGHRRAERHGDEALAHAGRDEPRPHACRRDQHRRDLALRRTRRPTTTPGPPATRSSASRSPAPTRRRDPR